MAENNESKAVETAKEVKVFNPLTASNKELLERFAGLSKENEELRKKIEELEKLPDADFKDPEYRKRWVEREAYMTKFEQDCEDKVANRDFQIRGLTENVARLTRRNEELETEMWRMKALSPWTLFLSLFKKAK